MVHGTIRVDAPLRRVYDQWTQFEEFPRFMHGVVAVEQTDARHLRWRTGIAGVRRDFDAEIVDQLPDQRIAWRTLSGGVRHRGVVTFEAIDAGHTRVRLAMEVEPEGMTERAAAALGIVSSRVSGDLRRFKDFVEDRHAATGAWRGRLRPGDAGRPRNPAPGPVPPVSPPPADPSDPPDPPDPPPERQPMPPR
ncbi:MULTISPECIES: SRPBCC family protein [Streptomyces]|uniref:Cyclase n=1 Tax=Streptomyces hydrogenans TaxID=1873719 RepID=A0ABQ3PLR5_9ACTN|nr:MULTISPECIES: SRPBCC family protein [Streptomyces]GHG13864.1 cyclase [Streptomyces hydrogenans]GHI25971.1 cyclase [Streptomyces hydrogenans]